jgi:hypothetical protein
MLRRQWFDGGLSDGRPESELKVMGCRVFLLRGVRSTPFAVIFARGSELPPAIYGRTQRLD